MGEVLSILVARLANLHFLLVVVTLSVVGLGDVTTEGDRLLEGALTIFAFVWILTLGILWSSWIRRDQIRLIFLLNHLAILSEHDGLGRLVCRLSPTRLLDVEYPVLARLSSLLGRRGTVAWQ